jgi:hypothetical protein
LAIDGLEPRPGSIDGFRRAGLHPVRDRLKTCPTRQVTMGHVLELRYRSAYPKLARGAICTTYPCTGQGSTAVGTREKRRRRRKPTKRMTTKKMGTDAKKR